MDLTSFGQLGVAGLAVYFFYKIASNHIDHNTAILGELRDTIKELTIYLKKDNKR